jgi:hypothetical protein
MGRSAGLRVGFAHRPRGPHPEVRDVIQHIEAGAGDEAATVWRQHLTFYVAEMLDGLKQ